MNIWTHWKFDRALDHIWFRLHPKRIRRWFAWFLIIALSGCACTQTAENAAWAAPHIVINDPVTAAADFLIGQALTCDE